MQGLWLKGSRNRAEGSGFTIQSARLMVEGSRNRAEGSGFRVQGLGLSSEV